MRRRAKLVVVAAAVALPVVVGLGCGPSFQAVYEGDVRFEHCYAVDENPSLSMPQKEACWKDWLAHYTYGQTRDRVAYAYARSRAMSRMGQMPTDEAMMGAAPGEVPQSGGITAPAPTSAFAPPPKTLDVDAGTDGGDWSRSAPAATWMSNLPPPPPPSNGNDGGTTYGGAGFGS